MTTTLTSVIWIRQWRAAPATLERRDRHRLLHALVAEAGGGAGKQGERRLVQGLGQDGGKVVAQRLLHGALDALAF
ncbi:hypothetical protein LP419_29270 [Massilia sp. H-1]|nr:hypothetical protein LP419_29270 [Massilia sp. H-1]